MGGLLVVVFVVLFFLEGVVSGENLFFFNFLFCFIQDCIVYYSSKFIYLFIYLFIHSFNHSFLFPSFVNLFFF